MCKELVFADIGIDQPLRFLLGRMERQDHIRHRTIVHLLVDGQCIPAPMASCRSDIRSIDHNLRPAALTFQGHDILRFAIQVG